MMSFGKGKVVEKESEEEGEEGRHHFHDKTME
jgi:hypothetical protein